MLRSQSFWACPGTMGEGRDCSLYLFLTEVCWWSGSAWGRGQRKIRWGLGVFLLKDIKGFLAKVNKRAIT